MQFKYLSSLYSNFSSSYCVLVLWRPSLLCRASWIGYSCREPRKSSLYTVHDLHSSGDVSINQVDTFWSYCKIPIACNMPHPHEHSYSLTRNLLLLQLRRHSKKHVYLAIILKNKSISSPCLSRWTKINPQNQIDYAKDEFCILKIYILIEQNHSTYKYFISEHLIRVVINSHNILVFIF